MEGGLERVMEGGWAEGWTEGWKEGWREGWRDGWWKGWKKGGREAGMVGGMAGGMEEGGIEGSEIEGGWTEGWTEGWTKGLTEGLTEGWTQGRMESGMDGGMEGGMDGGWREGWRDGWRDAWRLQWRKGEDEGRDGTMGWKEGYREGSEEALLHGGMVGLMEGGIEERKDFGSDIDKLNTEMEVLHFIKEKIYHPTLKSFFSKGRYDPNVNPLDKIKNYLNIVEIILPTKTFTMKRESVKQVVFDDLLLLAQSVMNFVGEIAYSSRKQIPRSDCYDILGEWEYIAICFRKIKNTCQGWEKGESERDKRRQSMPKVIDAVRNPRIHLNIVPKLHPDDNVMSAGLDLLPKQLLILKAFPGLAELKESSEMLNILLEVTDRLDEPIWGICNLLSGSYAAAVLIGSLLSFKRPQSDAWTRVHEDLEKVINNKIGHARIRAIFTYCLGDLPEFLQACFLYVACYPIGCEISATCLTQIWIAEGFVQQEKGETLEETAYKYVEQFVQRSLVWVSTRSYSGTIKYCRVPRFIHEIVIQQSCIRGFLVVNPDKQRMVSRNDRVAIHHTDHYQYTEVEIKPLRSLLAFDIDREVLGNATYLRVLELRNCKIREKTLSKLYHLQYMRLRSSNICKLPKHIDNMIYLQTIDVRGTSVETLPESLWNILTLRHVYTNPRPQIQGPPPTTNLSNLRTLKTVVVPESWQENFPHSLINLRKLALTNMDNPTCKPNPYWKSISNMLSRVVNLLSMTITGDIVPAEFVDTRAFPNLDTVKSIKLEGKWNYFKLTIDNNGFPPNLTKLTLTKSGLKEDPMPRLERLQALKYLSLKDGAYMGKKIVCSANGFPQLDFLELSELNNLEIWEANPMAMPQLTKLHVVKCCKLEDLPDLEHVIDKYIVK